MREYETGGGATRVLETGTPPVIAPTFVQPGAATGTYGYGSGGILEAIILASVLGGNRFGLGANGTTDVVTSQNTSELRKDVAESAAEVHKLGNEIQSAFAGQTASMAHEFRNLDNKICETDKAALESKYEAKIQTLESTNSVINKIGDTTINIKDQLHGISTNLASEFCDLKHLMEKNTADLSLQAERNHNGTTLQIEREFNKLEQHRLKDEVAALREQLECQRRDRDTLTNNLLMSQQTNSILNAIDSQLQRQTSQIVQFGTGNGAVSTPTATNNTVN